MTTVGRVVLFLAASVLAGCAPQTPAQSPGGPGEPQRPAARKLLTAAVLSQVPFAAPALNPGDAGGNEVVVALANSGFTVVNRQAELVPRLVESIPTVENGQWKVFADGRMEMTWKIRSDARWHDGTPFTSADAVFTTTVHQDKEALQFYNATYDRIERVDAPDPLTFIVTFSRPYIDADKLFPWLFPEHLASKPYREDKESFTTLPLWREEFVGTGPYRIKAWETGIQVVFEAFDGYFLGRPRIDDVVIRFITDFNTLLANLRAETIQVNLGRGLSLEQALALEQQWPEGRVDTAPGNVVHIWPQFRYTNPAVILDVRFRRAMQHALDRQEMADTLEAGRSMVGNAWIKPDDADYPLVERSIVRYEFDPRRAQQLIEELGYTRGSDSTYRDAAGQVLSVEIRTTGVNDIQPKSMHAIASYWQRIGVDVQENEIPRQLAQDLEYRTRFPGFEVLRGPTTPNVITSAELKVPERRYAGANYPSYSNSQYDALADRYYSTIPKLERIQIANEIMRWWSEHVVDLPLFFDVEPIAIHNRLAGPTARNASGNHGWNVHEWTLRD